MIRLTKLNGREFILNAEQIKTLEETPDTIVTLLNGEQMMIRVKAAEVVKRAIEYLRSVRTFAVPS